MAGAQYCTAVESCRGEARWKKTLSKKKETRELDAASIIVLLSGSRVIYILNRSFF